ncbi:(4Fe-4S)-binding protein [Aegicerativicinus sediminis]|uniref:(4Fe-4S)-binding protein n=1 Tax=Aegicerativicinus sediminis TaxID=2893202 RepID=UPI001E2B3DA0|nr:(4Fe-4S)-binding protein [Aegicerativicinus sediminis]
MAEIKEYSNGEITVVWKPEICIHSGICARGLPAVFQPKERPWIKTDSATSDEIVSQVKKCPSGALSIKQ